MTKGKTAEFFIELLSEEMPARMQVDTEKQLVPIPGELRTESRSEEISEAAEKRLKDDISAKLQVPGLLDSKYVEDAYVEDADVEVWSTPRRLAVCFSKVRVIEPAREEEKRGPRADAPEEAVNGFLRSAGITKEEAEIRQTSKGEFYFAVQKHKGRKAVDILPTLIAEVIADFEWPKSMRWRTGQKKWIRPLRGIVAIFDGKALKGEVDFGGGQTVSLGNQTRGHRFLDDNKLVTIKSGATYEETMKKHFVIVSRDARKDMIAEQIGRQNEGSKSLGIVNTALLDEVVGLVEHPNAIQIKTDEEFKALPYPISITAIETHQKLLHPYDSKTGEYLPNFVMIADGNPDKERNERIRAGVERVMRARLKDARFFLEEDEKIGLDAMRERLNAIAFFYGLGTMGDKTERLIKLTRDCADSFRIDKGIIEKAARYAKADLASHTVNELPALQGLMGEHLARQEYGDTVATAIADHYRTGDNSELKYHLKDKLQYYLSLIDRIDTLTAFVAIGKMPTGSKDPYALRRAGGAIVRIALQSEDRIPLGEIFDKALDYLEEDGVILSKPRKELYDDFILFIHDKAEYMLAYYGLDTVFSNSVFHLDTEDKDNMKYLSYLAVGLGRLGKEGDGEAFAAAYKRLANILDAEDKKDVNQWGKIEERILNHVAERNLYKAIKKAQKTISDAREKIDNTLSDAENDLDNTPSDAKNDLDRAAEEIKALKSLAEPINDFLEAVRVNDDDPKIRQKRLNLLHFARTEIKKVADFDKIQ